MQRQGRTASICPIKDVGSEHFSLTPSVSKVLLLILRLPPCGKAMGKKRLEGAWKACKGPGRHAGNRISVGTVSVVSPFAEPSQCTEHSHMGAVPRASQLPTSSSHLGPVRSALSSSCPFHK